MLPDIRIVPIEETKYWIDDIVKKSGRIASVYVFDANLAIHICSLTPSYDLRFVGFLTEKEIDEELWTIINEAVIDQAYYDKSILRCKYMPDSPDPDFPGYDDRELYDEWFEDLVESLLCNSSFFEMECLEILEFEKIS